ncbi:MAG: PLP-dependent aminotransferase family protein, partial [Burkholderiales bacterium]|nr:PLP-dependent aminotransferase family protein [Burkholderiales bacterium]
YRGASAPLHAAQADICPIPVDDEGLNVEYGRTHFPDARMIFVTPSHQMPLGMTMSLQRRMELLAWAQEKQTWILEDDYDSEYRFSGAPLASLQSLDRHGRVIYVGTMSKVLFPGLRLGYMVAPANLVDSLVQAKSIIDKHTAIVPQMVLADFIAEGHFGRHIKRMRKVYAERQRVLVETIESELSDELRCGAKDGGMDIAVFFKKNWSEQRIIDEGAARSLELRGLAHYAHAERNTEHLPHASGLLLGFSSMDSTAIRQGLMVLKEILTGHLNKT